jgi:hypothetical protein
LRVPELSPWTAPGAAWLDYRLVERERMPPDRHLDRNVAGVAEESGGLEWNFGRKRGLDI